MNLPRILLVQDLSNDLNFAMSALADIGLLDQTCVVRDEQEAIDFLYGRKEFGRRPVDLPAMVLLGSGLPPAKSLQLLAQIRQDPKLHRMPVIMMIASPSKDTVQKAYELRFGECAAAGLFEASWFRGC
jgi:CheY-like chemotaxis protein